MTTEFCCEGFEALIDAAGTRGFGLVVTYHRQREEIRCYLQARPFETETDYLWMSAVAEQGWRSQGRDNLPESSRRVPVTRVMSMKLNHCPVCGARIADAVQRSRTRFEELVALHESLVIES